MYAQKKPVGQFFFQVAHFLVHHSHSLRPHNFDIIAQAFDVEDFIQKHLDPFVARFEIQKGGCSFRDRSNFRCKGIEFKKFVQSRLKTFKRNGFEQIIHGIEVVAFQGIFPVGGGDDHFGRRRQGTQQGQTIQTRHLDVKEQQIDWIFPQISLRQHRIVKAGQQLKIVQLGQVFVQNLPRDGFVFNDYTANFFHCLSSNTTIKTSSSSSISRRYCAGYKSSRRRRTFSSPNPGDKLGLVELPMLFSTTHFS